MPGDLADKKKETIRDMVLLEIGVLDSTIDRE